MGRYFALTLNLPVQAVNKSKIKKSGFMKINLGFWLLCLTFAVGVAYLVQVNGLATKGYEIKKLEQKLTELKEIDKRLELEMTSLQSIQSIESEVKVLNLVPSSGVNYFKESKYALEQ